MARFGPAWPCGRAMARPYIHNIHHIRNINNIHNIHHIRNINNIHNINHEQRQRIAETLQRGVDVHGPVPGTAPHLHGVLLRQPVGRPSHRRRRPAAHRGRAYAPRRAPARHQQPYTPGHQDDNRQVEIPDGHRGDGKPRGCATRQRGAFGGFGGAVRLRASQRAGRARPRRVPHLGLHGAARGPPGGGERLARPPLPDPFHAA